jgi:GNAT superfamily N-acetyltransferase
VKSGYNVKSLMETSKTNIRVIEGVEELHAAAEIAALCHGRLRKRLPFLPERSAERFFWKIEWMAKNGVVLGLWRGGTLAAYLGGFLLENFRNAGPGCFSPDWSNGAADPETAFDDYRALYREIAPRWIAMGARIHSIMAYASEAGALEALSLTGFGRIVMDAAAPAAGLLERTGGGPLAAGIAIRRAEERDAEDLARLNAELAGHIGASPVLMPDTRGPDAQEWREWLAETDAVAFVAEDSSGILGFLKAQDPQFDVSDAVHDGNGLAINGMYCMPALRGQGIGRWLLGRMARHAIDSGKALMSVDCETTNLEAYCFWTRGFAPLSWSYERRV